MNQPHLVTTPTVVHLIDNRATGQLCQEWRYFKKVKQAPVALEMKISESMLSNLERGKKSWTMDYVTKFIRAVKTCREEKL